MEKLIWTPDADTDMPFEIFTLRNLINFYLI
jgi:hypothetical protein